MDLNVYKLIVTSDLYKTHCTIRAKNLQEASKQAKVKFAKSYKVFGDKAKVSLDETDLGNHIGEILRKLHN